MEEGFEKLARDINTEIDLLFDSGGLFKAPRRESLDPHSRSSQDGPERGRPQVPGNPQTEDDSPDSLDLNSLLDSADDSIDEVSSTFSARLASCVTECFEEFCFVDDRFDINHFLSLSRQLFNDDYVQQVLGQEPIDILRGKVLSTVLRKVFVRLSLSKSQIDALNRLVKAIILFTAPSNTQLARSIHAGYLSCLREAVRRTDERDSKVHALFEECRYFSIRLDTALFGQDNVMSCTVRFAFDDRIEQLPLFLSVCQASSGEEMAEFVYGRLKEKHIPFSKLLSFATDGASYMVGSTNGIVARVRRMVQSEAGRDNCIFQQVWCFAHRLNLVIHDFQNVPYINTIFHFLGWFTSKRKAVVYKKWLLQSYRDKRFPKIPKPSQTRWSFFMTH